MDQIKIGRFIAGCRKRENLTQMQLAEILGITDRAVSKWERGISLPDASIMQELCGLLHITVNDLLSGEVVTMEQYSKELENKVLELVRQKEESDKRMLTLELVVGILSLLVLLGPIFAAALLPMEPWLRAVLLFSGFPPFFVGLHFAIKLEQTAGYYRCGKCGHTYVPTLRAMYAAPHMGRTRYMRCPECGRRSWQKKVLRKD